jgi:hypothetical protein
MINALAVIIANTFYFGRSGFAKKKEGNFHEYTIDSSIFAVLKTKDENSKARQTDITSGNSYVP